MDGLVCAGCHDPHEWQRQGHHAQHAGETVSIMGCHEPHELQRQGHRACLCPTCMQEKLSIMRQPYEKRLVQKKQLDQESA